MDVFIIYFLFLFVNTLFLRSRQFAGILCQSQREIAIFALNAVNAYLFAEVVHNRFDYIKSEPDAGSVKSATLVALIETVKDVRQILF